MVKYFDISEWEEHQYYGTGGTRDKAVVENPMDSSLYYFKTSLKKKVIDYKYEFWSEIIASEIGDALGLEILHYDVAWKDNCLGCLSKSMIDQENEELQEGYKWLTGFDAQYKVNDKEAYTFQAIERLMANRFKQEGFIKDIIKIIIFDSIIGNEDRHQENWSIIVRNKRTDHNTLFRRKRADIESSYKFAPIYDSGSSMGRELTDSKISQMLKDSVQLEAYIKRGQSEIHWEGEKGKQKHLELISKISANGYKDIIIEIIQSINQKYNEGTIIDIISNICRKST
ncbi:MAG: HipA domain-containing protein, partial [Bacteroidales bacterium]|nr:HipA domain-containing protein [Bacteroidales bacterium]